MIHRLNQECLLKQLFNRNPMFLFATGIRNSYFLDIPVEGMIAQSHAYVSKMPKIKSYS
jgi:hypothetical protein